MLNIYLEAVSEKQTNRVVEILKTRIAKKFGIKLYAQNSTTAIDKEGQGRVYGSMFMFQDGKHAFRLNWKTKNQSSSIDSIDFWLKPAINPQFTAPTANLNIVDIVYLIDDVINNGKTGEIEIPSDDAEEPESEQEESPVTEAVGDKPKSFAARWREAQASGDQDEIRALKQEYKEKRKGKIVNVGEAPSEKLAAREPDEWSELFDKPLSADEIFSLMDDALNKVKKKQNKSILITGDPGIGKTYGVKQQLKGVNHEFFTGTITSASALYKVLYINNDPEKIIVFDDLDSLLDDRDCVNMLKGALDSGKETEISYLSNNTVPPLFFETILGYEEIDDVLNNEDLVNKLMKQKVNIVAMGAGQNAQKLWEVYRIRASSPTKANAIMPNKFNFDGRVIFISNKYLHEIPGAIKSRAMTVEVSLNLTEIIKRIEGVMKNIDITDATDADKKKALKFIKEKVIPSGRVQKLDFRTFTDVVKFAMSSAPEEVWNRWAAVSIMQKYATSPGRQPKR